MHDSTRTAAALVIGNELLTGKIRDRNVAVLGRLLFELGITLQRAVICLDDEAGIAADLDSLRAEHDIVFTSGGVGPTHDDVTIRAVARCLGRPVVRSRRLEALVRGYFGGSVSEAHLRMADVPEGTELVVGSTSPWPVVRVENVFVLPGLPEIFALKIPILREHLVAGPGFISRSVHAASDELEIADLLADLDARFPQVAIGSYPRVGDDRVRVMVTFDGRDLARVEAAAQAFREALPPDRLVEVEPASETQA
ncbi:MAG: molybdopterin-binding protein [Acidobacteriota bacterium]